MDDVDQATEQLEAELSQSVTPSCVKTPSNPAPADTPKYAISRGFPTRGTIPDFN